MATNSNPPTYFNCYLCGDCCSSWSIPIEREKAEVLLARAWVQERLKNARRELVPLSSESYRLPLTDENVCVFLGEDRRCLIEVHEGVALKPSDCKRFPFAPVKLPDGELRHDTSAVCKHISEQLLLAFQPILPKPEEIPQLKTLFTGDTLEELPEQVAISLFQKCSWPEIGTYWEVPLKAVFENPNISTRQALCQANALIRQWPDVPDKLYSARACGGFRLGGLITLCFLRKPYGTLSWVSLLCGKQYEDPRIFGFPVDLKAAGKAIWPPVLDRHLNAFLYNILTRKRLLARGASLESLLAMAVIAALLVRWYAAVLASLQNRTLISQTELTLAIRLVERYYTGHQPRFLKLFCSRWRGALLCCLVF
jgi:Fe-S-cluster containining protein